MYIGLNSVGLNSVYVGLNSVYIGLNSVYIGLNSVYIGLNSVSRSRSISLGINKS